MALGSKVKVKNIMPLLCLFFVFLFFVAGPFCGMIFDNLSSLAIVHGV